MEQTTHMKKLEAAGIKVYKVRAWLDHTSRRKQVRERQFEEVIIGDEKGARLLYKEQAQYLKNQSYISGYTGKAELIEPHIFENGTIAYWGEMLDEYTIGEDSK